MRTRALLLGRRFSHGLLAAALALIVGACGTGVTTYPAALLAPDGSPIRLQEVEAIVSDDSLDEEAKRAALRELGIEDEQVIDALLEL